MNDTSDPGPVRPGIPRAVELAIAVPALVVLIPVLLLAAVAVGWTSRGPALFRQPRIGRYGRPFTLYKLRTMKGSSGAQVTAADDQRITGVGHLLRKTKLDELPQLWNVISGDMSLVGARPEVPRYVDLTDPRWQTVLQARPGLTDPVSIRLRNEEMLLAAVERDRERFYVGVLQPFKLAGYHEYLQRRSWWTDLGVLGRTAVALVRPSWVKPASLEELLCRRSPPAPT